MRKVLTTLCLTALVLSSIAQNTLLKEGLDFRMPGKINPALAGLQGDLIKFVGNTDVEGITRGFLEGRIPFTKISYFAGVENFNNQTDFINQKTVNVNIARTNSYDNGLQLKYGLGVDFGSKSLNLPTFISPLTNLEDLDGFDYFSDTLLQVSHDFADRISNATANFGMSVVFNKMLFSISADNIIPRDISLDRNQERIQPMYVNAVLGGFLPIGQKVLLFPKVMYSMGGDETFLRSGIDINASRFTLNTTYNIEEEITSLDLGLAVNYKMVFGGVRYSTELENTSTTGGLNSEPTYTMFLNIALFKNKKETPSDFINMFKGIY